MVLKNPLHPGGEPTASGSPSFKVVDALVRKSLQINPELREGRNTAEVASAVRKELRGNAQRAEAQELPASATRSDNASDEHQLQTLVWLLDQKGAEFVRQAAELDKRIARIEVERQQIASLVIDDVVSMAALLMGNGTQGASIQKALHGHQALLAQLRTTDVDLVRSASARIKKK